MPEGPLMSAAQSSSWQAGRPPELLLELLSGSVPQAAMAVQNQDEEAGSL